MTKPTGETPRTDRFYASQAPLTRGEAINFARTLERQLADRDRELKECVELLTIIRKKLCYGDGDPWRRKVDALLARLKERT